MLAQDVLRVGGTVLLESGFWLRSDRDEKRLGARAVGAAVELHYLDVPGTELLRRLDDRLATDARTVHVTRAQLGAWANVFEAPDATEFALFDEPLQPAR
jgi:predicted kinase